MRRSELQPTVLMLLMMVTVTMVTVMGSYQLLDKDSYLTIIPAGIVVVLLALTYPQVVMLALVALIPMDTFAYIADFTQMLTLTKLLFPFALIGLIFGRLVNRYYIPALHRIDFWILLWISLNALLIINAQDTDAAITFVRRLVSMGLFYFVLSRLFIELHWNKRLQTTIICSAAVSVLFGVSAYFSGNNPFMHGYEYDAVRITGASHVSPNFYSIMLLLPLTLTVAYLINTDSAKKKFFLLLLAVLFVSGITLSFSRSGYLALGVTAILSLIIWGRRMSARQWGGLILLSFASLLFLPPEFWERIGTLNVFDSGSRVEESLSSRYNYILVGMNILKSFPLLGSGPGNYQILHALPEFQTRAVLIGVERLPHNMYLQGITETGIAGFFVLTGLLVSALLATVRGIKHYQFIRWLSCALLLALCGYLVMGLFSHLMLNKYLWVLLAMIRALPELEYHAQETHRANLRRA